MHHRPSLVKRNGTNRRFVFAEETRVDLDGGLVFGGNVNVFEDRVHRTDNLALLAIDADVGVNVELWGARGGMDTSDRANFHAGTIMGTETGNNVRHNPALRLESQITDFKISDLASDLKSEM
jgi:hypothetical protein